MTDPRRSPDNAARTEQSVIRIGTRGSPLALVQARQIAASLEATSGGALRGEIVPFTTTGDQLTNERLINAGGKGLFTKEIDIAVETGAVDIGVHSLKDVPSVLPGDHYLVCIPAREDPREGFLSHTAKSVAELPKGASIGTASLRREAQTLALRPDLNIVTFRGNVATRMRKLEEGVADATYLAMAGLTRLGLAHLATPVPVKDMMPAAAQGIIGVTAKQGHLANGALTALMLMDHGPTRTAAYAERAVLAALDGSCRTPIAAHLYDAGNEWHLTAEVLAIDGSQRWSAAGSCPKSADKDALESFGQRLGQQIRDEAGSDLPAFEDDA
jgi:hydroxymethylbilane synthase